MSATGGMGTKQGTKAAPQGNALTAEQTYDLALANNPDFALLAAEAEVAEAQIRAARQIENPQLRLTSFNIDDVAAAKASVNIGLRVPIPRPGTVRARVESAKLTAQARQSDAEDAKRQLRGSVYRIFASLAMFEADLEHAARVTELQAARRQQVVERLEQAVATKLDVALADVEHAEARDAEARVRESIALAQAELGRIAGTGAQQRFRAESSELRVVDLDLDADALTERAMAARPGLRAGHAGVGAAQAELHLARSLAWPWFDWAQAQYLAGPASTASSWGFGIALSLPVFSWNRGNIKAAKAVVRQREVEQRSRIAAVGVEIDEAIARVERTAARVHEIETGLLPRLEEASREAEAALATHAIDPLVANEVALRGVAAQRIHVAALLAHREAVIDLETVVGAPISASGPAHDGGAP